MREHFGFLLGDDGVVMSLLSQIGIVELVVLFAAALGFIFYEIFKTDQEIKKAGSRDDAQE